MLRISLIIKSISISIAFSILLMSAGIYAADTAQLTNAQNQASDAVFRFKRDNTYKNYLDKYNKAEKPGLIIQLNANSNFTVKNGAQIKIQKNFNSAADALVWDNKQGIVDFTFDVPKPGLYNIYFTYIPLSDTARNIELKMYINGQLPYDLANHIILPRTYKDGAVIKQDNRGNDIRPEQVSEKRWLTEPVNDHEGINNEPLLFYFQEGKNTLSIETDNGMFAIENIKICNNSKLKSYESYLAAADRSGVKDHVELFQCEKALYKSDSILYPLYDRSGQDTIPNDPVKLKLNTIGGQNWSEDGQFIVWNFFAPKDGWYKMGVRYRQNLAIGQISYRRLSINGEVPFEEAKQIPFYFSDKWRSVILGNSKNEWLFHLKAGQNEIRMDVVPGFMGEIIRQFEDISYTLNNIYRKIIMVTGTQPDSNRDYLLQDQIPGLMDAIKQSETAVIKVSEAIKEQNRGKSSSEALSILNTLRVQLNSFVDDPDSIPERIGNFQSNISSFSDYIMNVKKQPLELDYFAVLSPDKEAFAVKGNWLSSIIYSIKAFIGSFYNDYSSIGNVSYKSDAIKVWVSSLGRDQVQVIKDLSDNDFTPKTGIPVNVNLVQQSLTAAILSGRGPDIALFVADSPIDLAARGGLTELSYFGTFSEVKKRFIKNAFVPYQYNGGVYGIPISQSFPMLFCRTDIFNELNIEVPNTWKEFYNALAVIQKNNMNAGVGNLFGTLLYQKGSSYFKEDLQSTNFDTSEAISSFTQGTDLFTRYGIPLAYNFYTRFRTGEMPMGIEDYTTYNMLESAAPEISGLWGMYPIPGTIGDDGKINRTVIGANSAVVMLRDAKDKEAAWRFIDWFTSDKTQTEYGLGIESLLGPAGRFATANINAFENLPWDSRQETVIKNQWQFVDLVPQIPATYYVDRNLNNAFRQVVFYKKNPREILINYNRDINAEIVRKNNQLKSSIKVD